MDRTQSVKHDGLTQTIIFGSLILLMLIIPFNEGGNGHILQLLSQVLLLVCSTLWAIRVIRRRQLHVIPDWIDLWVLGFLVWAALSLHFADYTYAAALKAIKILSYAALFYLCRSLYPLKGKRTIFLAALLGSSVLQVFFALYSRFIRHTPGLQAGFVNPNNLACFLVIGFNIALGVLLFHPQTQHVLAAIRERRAPQNGFVLVAALLIGISLGGLGIAVLMIRSRGALIGLLGAGLYLTTLKKKRIGLLFVGIMGLMLFIPLPQGSLIQRLQKSHDPFVYQRVDIWKSSVRMIADHPVTGVGSGMYTYYGPAYNFPVERRIARYGKRLDMAHSDLLQIGAELGILGMILAVGGIIRIGFSALSQIRRSPISWQTAAASAGMLGVLIQGLFSNLLSSPAIAMATVVLASIGLEEAVQSQQRHWKWALPSKGVWQWYAGLALVIFYILVPVIGYPFFSYTHYLRYLELRQTGNIPEAVRHLQKALKLVPMQAYYHHKLGELYAAAFRNQPNLDAYYEGYKEFTDAIRYNPREARFYVDLAELHRAMYRTKLPIESTARNALRDYQRALQYAPFSPFIRFSMATLHADLEEFDQALALLREAVEIEPNFVGGYQMLGRMLAHLEREEEATEAFAQANRILQQYADVEHESEYIKKLLRPLNP